MGELGGNPQFKDPQVQTQTAPGGATNSLAPGLAKAGVGVCCLLKVYITHLDTSYVIDVIYNVYSSTCVHIDASRFVEDVFFVARVVQ